MSSCRLFGDDNHAYRDPVGEVLPGSESRDNSESPHPGSANSGGDSGGDSDWNIAGFSRNQVEQLAKQNASMYQLAPAQLQPFVTERLQCQQLGGFVAVM